MLVSLSSGNYDIVASGQAFLFSKDKDLRIDIQADNGFAFSLILNFIENESVEQDLQLKTNDREIVLTCINFANTGWAYLEGTVSRSVKYTLFSEK